MKFRILVEYEYPVEHKLPVKAELILHGDRVVTDNIKPLPKGHGRILDVDKLMDEIIRKRVIDDGHIEKWIQEYIDNDAEIIIEADKESEEV